MIIKSEAGFSVLSGSTKGKEARFSMKLALPGSLFIIKVQIMAILCAPGPQYRDQALLLRLEDDLDAVVFFFVE